MHARLSFCRTLRGVYAPEGCRRSPPDAFISHSFSSLHDGFLFTQPRKRRAFSSSAAAHAAHPSALGWPPRGVVICTQNGHVVEKAFRFPCQNAAQRLVDPKPCRSRLALIIKGRHGLQKNSRARLMEQLHRFFQITQHSLCRSALQQVVYPQTQKHAVVLPRLVHPCAIQRSVRRPGKAEPQIPICVFLPQTLRQPCAPVLAGMRCRPDALSDGIAQKANPQRRRPVAADLTGKQHVA